MSDEVKNPGAEPLTPEEMPAAQAPAAEEAAAAEEAQAAAEAAVESGAPEEAAADAQEKELNDLRDIFQKEWDKALSESQLEPPIQALDYSAPEEEAPEEETPEDETQSEAQPAKAKKEKKKRGKAPLVVLIVLLVLLLIPLSAYVFVTIKVPTFNSYFSAYAQSLKAEDPADKLSLLEEALGYCEEGSPLESQRQGLIEEIVLLKCKTDGYAAAVAYADENLTDEMRQKPENKEFAAFLEASGKIDAVADAAYDAVAEKFAAVSSAEDIDYDAVANALETPDLMRTEVLEALKHIGAALAAESEFKAAEKKGADGFDTAMTEFLAAQRGFTALGANGQNLLEHAAVSLYANGFVYETTVLIENYFTEEMLADIRTEEFADMSASLEALKNVDEDVYAVALALFENKTTAADDVRAALHTTLPDAQKNVLVKLAQGVIAALKAEEEKNLTMAQKGLTESINTLGALGMNTVGAAEKLIGLYLTTGDEQSAHSVRETYVTAETLENASDGLKSVVKTIDDIYAAESAVNEVFSPFYSNMYYSGEPLDKEEIGAALDQLLTPEADDYLTAYVYYFKYLTEGFTDADEKTMIEYLREFAKAFTEYPAFYNSMMAECYRMRGDYAEAEALADEALKINAADDYALSLKAMAERIKGNVKEALKLAENGVKLSGTVNNCAREALICYLLQGKPAKAWNYAKQLYDNSLTLDNCEYVLLTGSIAEKADEAVKNEINEYTAKVEEVLANNNAQAGEKAQGILNGELTMEDVFLRSPYYLR